MTPSSLRSYTAKDLAQMARQAGVAGWHGMRKAELIAALLDTNNGVSNEPVAERKANVAAKPRAARPSSPSRGRVARRIAELNQRRQQLRDLAATRRDEPDADGVDRLVVLVRDPYWLHACWELSPQGVDRARKALGQHWHSAAPVLRLYRLRENGSTEAMRQVAIHGGVTNWYVDVADPPARYRAEIGYAAGESTSNAAFFCIARSNEVQTPTPGAAAAIDDNWSDVARNADRVYAMSGGYSQGGASLELQELLEERLRRRLGRPSETRFGVGASRRSTDQLSCSVDAELIVYGSADPNSHVTVQGEPVNLAQDGAFAVKVPFPDRRQVIPVVASSADGLSQKTIILGVERNTKHLEQRQRDQAAG